MSSSTTIKTVSNVDKVERKEEDVQTAEDTPYMSTLGQQARQLFLFDIQRKSFWTDTVVIAPKVLYFFLCFAINACYTFRTRFFKDEFGISTQHYGLIACGLSGIAFCCAPVWAYVADRWRRPKTLLLLASMMEGCAFQLFRTVRKAPQGDMWTIIHVLLIGGFINCFNAVLYPLMDRIVLSMLAKKAGPGENSREFYGRQRLWGSIGNFLIVTLMGFLVEKFSYVAIYVMVGITQMMFFLIGCFLLPSDKEIVTTKTDIETAEPKKEEKTANRMEEIFQLLSNSRFMFFLLITLLNGLARAIGSHFMSNYLEDKVDGLGATKPQVSLANNCALVVEILIFLFSKNLTHAFGIHRLVIVSQICMIFRMGIHWLLPKGEVRVEWVYVACCAEVFKGISFGFMTASGVMVAGKEAPKNLQATAQGLFSGIYIGLAPCLAGLLGYALINNDVPLARVDGQSNEQYNAALDLARRMHMATRNGFFQDHTGLFRLATILSTIAFILLMIKTAMDYRSSNSNKNSRVIEMKKISQ